MSNVLYFYHDQLFIAEAVQSQLTAEFPQLKIVALSRGDRVYELNNPKFNDEDKLLMFNFDGLLESGFDVINKLRLRNEKLRFIVISLHPRNYIDNFIALKDADVVINRNFSTSILLSTIASLNIFPGLGGDFESIARRPKVTRRQMQLLSLMEMGHPNLEISKILEISETTVKVHLWRLYQRLGVNNRLQAVHAAKKWGILAKA